MKSKAPNLVNTIEITDFSGRLTRKLNGDLNSGFANFSSSSGYDPFSKPGNLTWLEAPVDITSSTMSGNGEFILAAKARTEGAGPTHQYVYVLGAIPNASVATLYKIEPNSQGNPNIPNLDTVSVIGTVSARFNYGASMEFYNAPTSVASSYERIYVGSDNQVNSIAFDGSNDVALTGTGYASNTYRPLKKFVGKLIFGNGNTIGAISATTGTVTSSIIGTGRGNLYSELDPPLPVDSTVHDIDLSVDGNYLLITASGVTTPRINLFPSDQNTPSSDGTLNYWSGGLSEGNTAVTQINSIPSYAVTALQTYLQTNLFFATDAFGSSLNDGTNKLITLPNNQSPTPNGTLVNGNFISWIVPETIGGTMFASMYYYGALDQENPAGLYRLFRLPSPIFGGFVYQTPLNLMTNSTGSTVNINKLAVTILGYGKHYFSTWTLNSTTNQYQLWRFLVTPSGSGTAIGGVYETQTQLFPRKIAVKQVRVYTEPTVANNAFQLDFIGSDGNPISNGEFTYIYAAGTDETKLQGSLERIDFNPAMKDTYALGIRIGNSGTVNMTIKKIEIDWAYSGK